MAAGARAATAAEKDRVFAPIVLGFSSDPLLRWFFPEPRQYLDAFPQLVAAVGAPALEHGSAHCVDTFSGGALWLPPGVEPDGQRIGTLLQRAVDPERLPALFSVIEEKGRYHPTEPHWYLHMIGVDPSQQGKGHGTALLGFALERVDRDHLAAYLESSNPANVPLYERHGFEVIATVEVAGAPPVFPMLRRSR